MINTIVFDFDGVIVRNSEFGKEKVWEHILPKDIQEHVKIAREKITGGRGSRLDVLREIVPFMNIKPEQVDAWVSSKSKEFDDFTRQFTLHDGILEGDRKTLEVL